MREHFDGHRAFVHIEKLSSCGRLPGTPGESAAREYIEGVGAEIGVPMRREGFTYSSAPLYIVLPLVCAALGAVALVGAVSFLWESPLMVVPGGVLLAALYAAFRWSAAFERFGAAGGKKHSSNLIGEISSGGGSGTVILSAHYDSKSQVMPVMVRAALFILGFFSAVMLGIALLAVGALTLAGVVVPGMKAGFYAGLLPAACILALTLNFTGNRSPGALDNAAGEAVILEAARILADDPPENLAVVIASFGCEEVGLTGSINYLLANEERLKSASCYMLNLDIPFSPSGKLYLNTGFELPPVRTSSLLNGMAREAARSMGLEMKGIYLPVGAAADHMPWVKHGFEATGIVSPSPYIHSSGDSPDRIDREALRRVGEIALSVVRLLDGMAARGKLPGRASGPPAALQVFVD